MTDHFRDMFEGLKETADGLIAANQGIKKVADAALQANREHNHQQQEHDDLRETIKELQAMILDLIRKQGGAT